MQGSLRLLLVGAPLLFTPDSFAFPVRHVKDVRRAVPRRENVHVRRHRAPAPCCRPPAGNATPTVFSRVLSIDFPRAPW
jgi:hypothetical protein